jgi:hypothetical protein
MHRSLWRKWAFPATTLFLLIGVQSAAMSSEDPGWPREITLPKATILVYQPQLESFQDNDLSVRAAVSVTPESTHKPVFGVAWFDARVQTDLDTRMVDVLDVKVKEVRFPEITDDQKKQFAGLVEGAIPEWDLSISLDRLLAGLEVVEKTAEVAKGLKFDPPAILYSDIPAVLVTLDGEPIYKDVEDSKLRQVLNTPFLLVKDTKSGLFWLDGGVSWYSAKQLDGPWKIQEKAPKKVRKLKSAEGEKKKKEQDAKAGDGPPPRIFVATEPTELIVTDGKPDYSPLEGVNLLYVKNSPASLVMDVDVQQHYVVLSGRWFRSKALTGPWEYVAADSLPASFASIPEDSPLGAVLVHVPGTEQAKEALLESQIPQTAAVNRNKVNVTTKYDGEPQFKPIEGTSLQYAINTSSSVLKIEDKYYLCDQAVWYFAYGPKGPWRVADHRPDGVESIPASNPHDNVKYVEVYDSTPDVVYVGYTPGYVGSYAYGGCMVYGTGYYYQPWYGSYYYPHHATWGFSVHYNPWYGWGVGLTYSNGPFSITFGGYGHGGYYPYGNYWGPRGYVPVPVYRPRPGYGGPGYGRPGYGRPGDGRPSIQPVPGGGDNLYNRPGNRDKLAEQFGGRSGDLKRSGVPEGARNNLYADRDGNVHRQTENGWQQRDKGSWNAPERSGDRQQQLNRDQAARQRGAQRSGQYQGARPSGGSRGATPSRARSGGGRRR